MLLILWKSLLKRTWKELAGPLETVNKGIGVRVTLINNTFALVVLITSKCFTALFLPFLLFKDLLMVFCRLANTIVFAWLSFGNSPLWEGKTCAHFLSSNFLSPLLSEKTVCCDVSFEFVIQFANNVLAFSFSTAAAAVSSLHGIYSLLLSLSTSEQSDRQTSSCGASFQIR